MNNADKNNATKRTLQEMIIEREDRSCLGTTTDHFGHVKPLGPLSKQMIFQEQLALAEAIWRIDNPEAGPGGFYSATYARIFSEAWDTVKGVTPIPPEK